MHIPRAGDLHIKARLQSVLGQVRADEPQRRTAALNFAIPSIVDAGVAALDRMLARAIAFDRMHAQALEAMRERIDRIGMVAAGVDCGCIDRLGAAGRVFVLGRTQELFHFVPQLDLLGVAEYRELVAPGVGALS